METTTAGVLLSGMFMFSIGGAHGEETVQPPQPVVAPQPQPKPIITVNSRASVHDYEATFGCDIQDNLRPDTTHRHWATLAEQACAQQIAFEIGENSYGWGLDQQRALTTLWTHESAWSANADNAHSSAYGIPQAMTSRQLHGPELARKFGNGAYSYYKNPVSQIQWGLEYIHRQYGTPVAANKFWHSQCGSAYGCWY